jgi:hypothetical protein
LIDKADVVKMYVPFPDIDSSLALYSHMYICLQNGNNKELIKCQTFKPTHILSNYPPMLYLIEIPDINRNPFNRKTTIDCDKSFCVSGVLISKRLLARRNVCHNLFNSIIQKMVHSNFCKENLNSNSLSRLNRLISLKI